MRGARLRDKLRRGEVIVNMGLTFHSPTLVEILGYTDVDDIYLDAEHGSINEAQCEDMVRAADLLDKPVIIRVPRNDPATILRYLDIGASGIIAPHVTTRRDAERAVEAVKYGPLGRRSFAGGRANGFGMRESAAAYIERANRETLVIGLFEDVDGLDNLSEVLSVDGLDALIIGPNDLAFSMGYPAQPWHPEVQKVVDQIIAHCRAAGKPTGLPAVDLAQARQHAERGCQIVTVNIPNLLLSAAGELVQHLHAGPASGAERP